MVECEVREEVEVLGTVCLACYESWHLLSARLDRYKRYLEISPVLHVPTSTF